jgi:hypothetical protein
MILTNSTPNTPLSEIFRLLGLSTRDVASPVPILQSSDQVRYKRTQGTKMLETGPVYTKRKYGQKIDDDLNYGASTFIGRSCQMSLFDSAALPVLLVEAKRPLVSGRNVVASEDYELDLLIFIDCWVQCQNGDFKSYLNAPEEARPPTRIVTSRRAMLVGVVGPIRSGWRRIPSNIWTILGRVSMDVRPPLSIEDVVRGVI